MGSVLIGYIKHDITAQTLYDGTGYGESDTCSLTVIIQLHKLLEDMFSLRRGHTDTRIFYRESHMTVTRQG